MNEIQDEIKKAVRHLDIQAECFSPNMIEGWEKEYDTQLDNTNFFMFIYDRFDNPIKYLHMLKKECIKSPRIQELKQENMDLLLDLHR
tara:strand:+ start:528 stop:791 length:264 start_codon:yes stop_codon:yes gene_type:complete